MDGEGGRGRIRVGCAGWSLPLDAQPAFPAAGTHLERYAARFPVSEINSSFHKPHRPSTYERWAASVPDGFRFSAKLPKTITHQLRLRDADAALDAFLGEVLALGARLACLLVQLPPGLAFDAGAADRFFLALRERTSLLVACEPRNVGWFGGEAAALLASHRVARVAADPARVPDAGEPGGWTGLAYVRLHGSPRTYYSAYDAGYIHGLALRLQRAAEVADEVWCIFDNTAAGAAVPNALELMAALGDDGRAAGPPMGTDVY
jgi:uncharacterized protein YecE (DUF72 family)